MSGDTERGAPYLLLGALLDIGRECQKDVKSNMTCLPPAQAQRLVKNSIIAVEAPDEDMAEEDFVEDEEEFEDVARRHRGAPNGDGGAGNAPGADDVQDGAVPRI